MQSIEMSLFPWNDTDFFTILALERIQQDFLAETQRNLELEDKGVVLRRAKFWNLNLIESTIFRDLIWYNLCNLTKYFFVFQVNKNTHNIFIREKTLNKLKIERCKNE